MFPTPSLSDSNLNIFHRQLSVQPPNITQWPPSIRISLLRAGLIDLTIYGHRIASAPRLALMAASPNLRDYLTKHPVAPAVNFTFDALSPTDSAYDKIILSPRKMSDPQIKIHGEALVAIARWLTALCTPPTPQPLAATALPVEVCVRFICTHVLNMGHFVRHLTAKFVAYAGKLALSSRPMAELVRSCRGSNDELLRGLAERLVEKRVNGVVGREHMDAFLRREGYAALRERVAGLEREMGFESVVMTETGEGKEGSAKQEDIRDRMGLDDVGTCTIEVDAEGWQVFPDRWNGDVTAE